MDPQRARSIRAFIPLAAIASILVAPLGAAAQDAGGGSFYQTYKKRQAQRFDLISYLSDQKRIRAEQDAKWGGGGSGGGLPFAPDLVLSYGRQSLDGKRGGGFGDVELSDARAQFLMNGLFREGSARRLLNIDLGFEGFHRDTLRFSPRASAMQDRWSVRESGGGILLRPFGRSSQDTGLMLKAGWTSLEVEGLWGGSQAGTRLSSPYAGGEAKIYLLPFLGARAEYTTTFQRESSSLGGRWRRERLTYGAFVEFLFLSVEAQVFEADHRLRRDGSTEIRDRIDGFGLTASLYF